MEENVLEVKNLSKFFQVNRGLKTPQVVQAVNDRV